MANFTKEPLSENATGSGILIINSSTPGTLIHEVAGGVTDEVWLYATNNDASSINLTIEFGDTTTTNNIKQAIPATSGLTIIVPGLILLEGQTVSAFAATLSKISIFGYVNRISA